MQTISYELAELERIIFNSWNAPSMERDVEEQLRSVAVSESVRIRQTFTQEVFSFKDERHLERYIQYHQQALIRLLDLAFARISIEQEMKTSPDLDRFFYEILDGLLDFVERHFSKYFDQDAKAPEGYIAIARHDAQQNVTLIQDQLTVLRADPSLIDVAVYGLVKLLSFHTTHAITYRKIIYLKELQKELLQAISNTTEATVEIDLLQSIYYLNYNSMRCFIWHTKYIARHIAEEDTHEGRMEVLSLLLKNVKQSQVKPGAAYHHMSVPLKAQLVAYLEEEIHYQQRISELGHIQRLSSKDAESIFLLRLDLSLAVISCIVRVLVEMKVILNDNVMELLRVFAQHVISKRGNSNTFGSFRVKYYDVEDSTRQSVKEFLLAMVKHISAN